MIKVEHLRKVYRTGKEKVVALDDINLELAKGEFCCIVGASGSGKSTLLNQLAGLEKPSRGSVVIDGQDVSAMNENQLAIFRQQKLGFVFQSYNLLPTLTAVENVALPLMFKGVAKRKREKMALEQLKKMGLGKRGSHKPTQMSGGQQQRVGIARAFVGRPAVIFADEPTGNLDSHTTVQVMKANNIKDATYGKQGYDNVFVKVDDVANVEAVEKAIKEYGYETYSMSSERERMREQSQMIQLVLGGIGAVSLFVAALSIANTMTMAIYERTREIGVMKVLGCKLSKIREMFLFEAAMIGMVGGVAGVGISYGLSFLLNHFGPALQGSLGGMRAS